LPFKIRMPEKGKGNKGRKRKKKRKILRNLTVNQGGRESDCGAREKRGFSYNKEGTPIFQKKTGVETFQTFRGKDNAGPRKKKRTHP